MNPEEPMPSALVPLRIRDLLDQSPFPTIRRLSIVEDAEEVVLTGTVASYHLKQIAQEMIFPFLAGRRLRNCITVVRTRGAT